MRQHLSVLMLAARNTIYRVIGLFAVTAVVETLLFYSTLRKILGEDPPGLEHVMSESRIALVCAVSFLLLCTLLSFSGCDTGGSRLRYTLQRLSVGERTIVFWWAVYNMACFFLFWALHVVIVLLLSQLYVTQIDATYVSNQTILLAFYRNNFMHSLLPLAETSRYLRNASFVLGLGTCTASFSYQQRRGKKGIAVVVLAALVVVYFARAMGSFGSDLMLSLIALGVTAGTTISIWKGEGYEVDAEV